MPKDIPRHIPIPIPAMLFNTFIKTALQSIAALIPIVTPIIIFLLFISFILQIQISRHRASPIEAPITLRRAIWRFCWLP